MTTSEALNALAERVERDEPSFELDSTIFETALRVEEKRRVEDLPAYTTSLDAAVTLNNWCIAHLSEIGGDGMPMCVLTDGTQEAKGYCLNWPLSGVTALARALTAAALRAKAAALRSPQ